MSQQSLLYHEKQVAALCGVHCINTLLQGTYFSEVDLADIGLELDRLERQVMQESGVESEDYLKYMAEESGNVAADGMFSVQVLSKALQNFGLQILPVNHPDAKGALDQPQLQAAFICNLEAHWLTIRPVGDEWWNFNSLFPAPEHLSTFYLSAFLATLKEQGYTIFVVQGKLPPSQYPMGDTLGPGVWFTPEQARQATVEARAVRQDGRTQNALEAAFARSGATGGVMSLRTAADRRAMEDDAMFSSAQEEDADLAAAIAASLADQQAGAGPSSSQGPSNRDVAALLRTASPQSSSLAAHRGSSVSSGEQSVGLGDPYDDDPELAAAIAASMEDMRQAASQPMASCEPMPEEPAEGPGVVELAFRLPGGARAMRRFKQEDALDLLYRYLQEVHQLNASQHVICRQFPRKELANDAASLESAGVGDRETLNVEKRL